MHQKIILIFIFFIVSMKAFSVQCPTNKDWIHKMGEDWRLSQKAYSEGWLVSQKKPMNHKKVTTLPATGALIVNLIPQMAECVYLLEDSDHELVAYQAREFNTRKIVKPPFFNAFAGYTCQTISSHSEKCRWEWN